MNKFFILGAPRTGTTALAKTLNSYDDIYIYKKISNEVKDNETELFEPFATFGSKIELDWEEKLNKVENEYNSKYNGFKLITGDTVHPLYLIYNHGYKSIVIIRKNIWKSLFSKIAAIYEASKENTNSIDVYSNSSKDLKVNFSDVRAFVPRLMFYLHHIVKITYELENSISYIDKIYFEDMIQKNKTYENLNSYFDQEIIFNLNYNDNFDIRKQYLESNNWREEYYKILEDEINGFVKKIDFTNKKIPQYLEECLVNHPFLLDK